MAVTLPNAQLVARVRSHEWTRDARGTPVPTNADQITDRGPYPGGMAKTETGSWEARLDPRMDPLRQGDEVTDGVRVWTLTSDPIFHKIPYCSAVDHIAANATLNDPITP